MKTYSNRFFAHRGLHGEPNVIPENSMAAFHRAVTRGYGIEMDVRLTADGQAVLFHDDDLERLCGCTGTVETYTYKQLQLFPLHGSEEKIPLLKDVLQMVGGRVPLLIEIKTNGLDLSVCEETARLLDAYEGDYCIESFHPYVLYWFRRHRPLVPRGQLATDFIKDYPKVSLIQRILMQPLLTNLLSKPNFISFSHVHKNLPSFRFWKKNRTTFGWTFRSAEDVRACEKDFDYFIVENTFSS